MNHRTFILLFISLIVFDSKADSLQIKIKTAPSIKLDLVSVYYTLFDVRKQLRFGVEYQSASYKRISPVYHLDAGLFDSYKFNKYFDFFNTSGGIYHIETKVKTIGFHFISGIKYNIKPALNKKYTLFLALQNDLNCFKKDIQTHNSKTNESTKNSENQIRMGLGPEIGLYCHLKSKFTIELKTALFLKLFTLKSKQDSPDIKPYKAVWYDTYHSFWIIPRINICYGL